jgi:hypothetical protein
MRSTGDQRSDQFEIENRGEQIDKVVRVLNSDELSWSAGA